MTESSSLTFKCTKSKCKNLLHARIVEHSGGLNDYGSWIVKCEKCKSVFSIYIGRDVNDSRLTSGGEILGKYNSDIYTDKMIRNEIRKFQKL